MLCRLKVNQGLSLGEVEGVEANLYTGVGISEQLIIGQARGLIQDSSLNCIYKSWIRLGDPAKGPVPNP